MIEKDELFQRCWVEFTINAEFQCRVRHPIRFPGSIDSESVGVSFRYPRHRVEKRGGEEDQRAKNQCEQRKSGRIGNSADAPFVAPAPDGGIEENPSKCESNENENSQIGQ